jgi:hypothetical protein
LIGHQLDVWPIQLETVRVALIEDPNIEVSFSSYRAIRKWMAGTLYPKFIHAKILFPFFFYWTMKRDPDPRLPELTQGLGVVVDGRAKYYPVEAIPAGGIEDRWLNRTLCVRLSKTDGVPHALWSDTNERPLQLLTRWYGFAFTYPGCEIYEGEHLSL